MRLFDVLPNFPFTTSETMPDYYLQRWCIKVASRAAVKNLRVASRPKKERLKVSRSTLFHMKTRVSLKCFVTGCLWKPLNDASLLKSLWNVISLTILVILKLLTLFKPKVRATKLKKGQKFALFDNCLSDILTEVKIWYWNNFKFFLGRLLER